MFVNKEKGIVHFIGTTEFAPGMWLGIELRTPSMFHLSVHVYIE